jgi:hypothetical protein
MEFEKKVIVTGDSMGNVISLTKNPNIGYIRVEQFVEVHKDNGWVKIEPRSALIKGDINSLKLLNYKSNQKLDGKIVVQESLIPFSIDYPERDYKIAGSTGVVCKYNDNPIYRITKYTTDENEKDEFIKTTNLEEINSCRIIDEIINSE